MLAKLKTMSDGEIQAWLVRVNEKVDPKALAVALLGVDDEIKGCVFRNISEHAVAVLKAEIDRFKKMDAKEIVIHMHGNILEKLL